KNPKKMNLFLNKSHLFNIFKFSIFVLYLSNLQSVSSRPPLSDKSIETNIGNKNASAQSSNPSSSTPKSYGSFYMSPHIDWRAVQEQLQQRNKQLTQQQDEPRIKNPETQQPEPYAPAKDSSCTTDEECRQSMDDTSAICSKQSHVCY